MTHFGILEESFRAEGYDERKPGITEYDQQDQRMTLNIILSKIGVDIYTTIKVEPLLF